jgi:integrase
MASIRKRGKSYLIQVSMPDGQGDYVRKSSTYAPPPGYTPTQAKRGADKYAIEFEQICKGLLCYDENMTLDELQAWYMSDIAPNRLKRQTADVNTRFYSYYIQPILGRYKLRQLTPVVLDNAFRQIQASGGTREYYIITDVDALKDALRAVNGTYRKMAANGVIGVDRMTLIARGGRTFKNKAQAIADYCNMPLNSLFVPARPEPLNSNTVKKIQHTLGALLSTATQKGILRFNPMLNTEPIKAGEIDRPVMNIEQARLFLARLERLDNISVRALLSTALFTGMRSGELRALQWTDVDTQRGLIEVNKNLDDMNRTTTPKTKASSRFVQIDFRFAGFLNHYHGEQQAYIVAMRGRVADNGIVFPAITTGKYMNRNYPNKVIKDLVHGTDIPQDLHIHSLRHCFTSILINTGADAKKVQAALGHSSVTTTQDIYSHIFAETLARSMQGVSLALVDGDNIFGVDTQKATL